MVIRNPSILPGIARDIAELARRRLHETVQPTGTDTQGLFQLYQTLTELLQRSWIVTQEAMNEGVEADMLRAMLMEIRDGVSSVLDIVPSFQKLVVEAKDSQKALNAGESTLRTLRDEATKLLDWLAAPQPPLDAERLARGRAQVERGEVVNADDFLAQLQAGEGS